MRLRLLLGVLRARAGSMAVETALVAPVLALFAVGTFQVGSLISRQQELQSGASQAEGIILAAANGTGTNSNDIKNVIKNSLGLQDNQVSLQLRYRCGTAPGLTTDASSCPSGTQVYQYILLTLTDTYTPAWAQFGVGGPYQYNVTRTIQVS